MTGYFSPDMKISTIAWILVVVFFTTSVLFACLYLSERHTLQRTQIALDMTEKSEAELRSNVQTAIAQSDKRESQAAAQDKINAVCGIYRFSIFEGAGREYDLRSDGTAKAFKESTAGFVGSGRDIAWTMSGNIVTIGNSKFTIEGNDLIDSRGNRWLHIR
jgi:hypothetical protein